jgi:uncharacterized protein (DUF433 family)
MKNIVVNKGISSGAPIINGSRLTIFNVVSKIFYEDNLEIALDDYEISIDIAKEAVKYCKNLDCQKDNKLIKFCSGCILRTLQDGWDFKKENCKEFFFDEGNQTVSITKDGDRIFLGSLQTMEDNDFGKAGWVLASEVEEKYPVLASPANGL